mmetsp:Transcript_3652/g.8096  ORF Transcript_3652/g.8096 Transcript_3652/m.8096 type:complete len:123 (-) Transcript_3652:125-493(-)
MGELEENEAKLRELVDAANGISGANAGAEGEAAAVERTCHLVTIPAGVLPSDVLETSPIYGETVVEEVAEQPQEEPWRWGRRRRWLCRFRRSRSQHGSRAGHGTACQYGGRTSEAGACNCFQ